MANNTRRIEVTRFEMQVALEAIRHYDRGLAQYRQTYRNAARNVAAKLEIALRSLPIDSEANGVVESRVDSEARNGG